MIYDFIYTGILRHGFISLEGNWIKSNQIISRTNHVLMNGSTDLSHPRNLRRTRLLPV